MFTGLGIGSVRDEARAALKTLKKGSKDIVELAVEAEKLTKRLHPRDEKASERHAVDAFLGALDRTLAAEVQKLGHKTMEDIVAAACWIEKILEEQTDTEMERLVSTMQDQIRLLKKDLKEANEQIAAHRTAALPVAAMAAVPAPTAATAAPAQLPPAAPARHIYQDYGEEPPFYHPPRHQMDHLPSTLLPLRRRRPLCVQLSCQPRPSTPPPPASTHQRPRPASRTNTGAASQRGQLPP